MANSFNHAAGCGQARGGVTSVKRMGPRSAALAGRQAYPPPRKGKIHLGPGKANVRDASRSLAGHADCRKSGFKIFTVQLCDVTLDIWGPPMRRDPMI